MHRMLLLVPALVTLFCAACERNESKAQPPEDERQLLSPVFSGADTDRLRIDVRLEPVAQGFGQITDIQFHPSAPDTMIVLAKGGEASWYRMSDGARGRFLQVDVITPIEMGLLGIAFHPGFAENGKFYLNYNRRDGERDVSVVSEWVQERPLGSAAPDERRVIMTVEQPFANHNAGQLAFGPDGYLYVGWGDGGGGGDPLEAGQDTMSMLGAMLRIDVDERDAGKEYAVPADNPFVGQAGHLPEIWATGLRNPWRYSFSPAGRLILADVGQNAWEEINIVARGRNYGWNVMEGRHCFSPSTHCPTTGLTRPIYEYAWGREEGRSIVGGYVYTGDGIRALRNKYVFGDYVTSRIWAIDIPEDAVELAENPPVWALGEFPITLTTFGRAADGQLYVGDFQDGIVYRLVAP